MKKGSKKTPAKPVKSKKKERALEKSPTLPAPPVSNGESKWQEFLRRHTKVEENK